MNTNVKFTSLLLGVLMPAMLAPHRANAQHILRLGPAVGLNMASLSIDGTTDNSIHAGAIVGAVLELGFMPMGALSIQPHFVQKGTSLEQPYSVFGTSVKYSGPATLNYIEIPVVMKWSLSALPLSPYVFIGSNIGFLLSASADSLVASGKTSESDIKNNIASTDFAIDVGAGIEVPVLPLTSFTADIRYSLGLTNNNNSNTISTNSIHTRDIKIIVGMLFGI